MKLLIIRHGDPNYEIDGLTEKGEREVALLTDRLCREERIDKVYCSTYGRAKLTIEPTLKALGMQAEYCEWLREFNYSHISLPYLDKPSAGWDLLPQFMSETPELYSPTQWRETDIIKGTQKLLDYDHVCASFDAMMAKHGYEKSGCHYKAIHPNHDTVLLVCHFGVTAVLLSHVFHCSPYSVWQHCITLPTSITTVYTEERRDGIASLRVSAIGDTSHLYEKEPLSFSGRFCECFSDNTRHD